MRHSSDLITVLGADGRIVYQSPSSLAVLGFDPDELAGTRFEALLAPGDSTRLIQILGDGSAREAGQTEVLQAALRHHDGTVLQFEIQYTNLLEDEHVNGIVLNARDISERAEFEEQLSHQAFHDPVTGLANRALFGERVRHASARALREGGGVGVVFLDLDDFKTVNDSLGHAAGDEVLAEFAKRLESVIRASDTAARFGGDEFADPAGGRRQRRRRGRDRRPRARGAGRPAARRAQGARSPREHRRLARRARARSPTPRS